MTTLDTLEKEHRKKILLSARENYKPRWWLGLIIGTTIVPFASAAFLFIPFMGQAMTLLSIALTILYLYLTRAWLIVVAGIVSGLISFILLNIVAVTFLEQFMLGAYALFGFASAAMITYLVGITGAIWYFYAEGERHLEQKLAR
jgi:hypothetical protein